MDTRITESDAAAASDVMPGRPRTTVLARLTDGRLFEAPPGTPLVNIVRTAYGEHDPSVVAAIVNGRLRELTVPLQADADVRPITTADTDGTRIYRRSLSMLLTVAAGELFPDAEISVEHAASGAAGFYCEVRRRPPFTQSELDRIDARMREVVARDEPITRQIVPVGDAIELFRTRGDDDKARLLAHRRKDTIALYTLRGRRDHSPGYMVPSTACLKYFALRALAPGFMLLFPHQGLPAEVPEFLPYPKLFAVFEQAGAWLERLGIRSAGALNDAIVAGRLQEISLVAEALHEAGIARIARAIAASHDRIRIVLVAGPTSSGKTTFAKRLAIQLLASGLKPFALGLDDYFMDRDRTPRDESGECDYESLQALDLELFNEHLASLIAGRTTTLPRYAFVTGRREAGPTVTLGPEHVIVVEGIHGLNPALVAGLPPERVYRVYASALTQLNLDRHNRVSTADSRLIRRIVRDAATRGYSAGETIRRWESVTRGEKQHIFCFQENADAIFNSALVHELAVLRPMAEPLLLQVRPETREFTEANRLLAFLEWFRAMPPDCVPDNSILREFIGGSIVEQFRLWGGS